MYEGLKEANGEEYYVEPADEDPNAFCCNLDVVAGAWVFGAVKGALDGGFKIHHR